MDWIEVAMIEYQTLRDEILLSFENQQQILNYGIASIGIAIGFGASKWEEKLIVDALLLVIIPLLSHLITLVWNGEINRISRAGRFISDKEKALNEYFLASGETDIKPLNWENWLRIEKSKGSKKNFKTKWNYYAIIAMIFSLNITSVTIGLAHNYSISNNEFISFFMVFSVINILAFFVHFYIFNMVKK
jgi:predicted transporter